MMFPLPRLFSALQLLQPWMLIFGLGVLIPILIHVWNWNRQGVIRWAATGYLELAMQRLSRRMTLQQWVLLLIRMLIVSVLAISLAAPIWELSSGVLRSQRSKSVLHVVLLDASYSMQTQVNEVSNFEMAKGLATRLVDDFPSDDAVVVFMMHEKLTEVLPQPTADRSVILNEVELLFPSNRPSRPRSCLVELSNHPLVRSEAMFDQTDIHVIGDFMGDGWTVGAQMSDALMAIEEKSQLQFHSVVDSSCSNHFVKNIRSDSPRWIVNTPQKIDVEVQQIGGLDPQRTLVEILSDQKVIGSRSVLLEPNSSETVSFSIEFSQPGQKKLTVRLADDQLLIDNRRYFLCHVVEKYNVLFVEDRYQSSRFLQLALAPEPLKSSFNIRRTDSKDFFQQQPDDFDVIFLDNVRELTDGDVTRLRRFASQGNTVVIFLGDLIDRDRFQNSWSQPAGNLPGLPIDLVGIQSPDQIKIDPLDYLSPILSEFRGNPSSGLTELPIWSYHKVNFDTEDDRFRVDMALANRDPLLVTCRMGKGLCILMTTASSSIAKDRDDPLVSWNAIETSPVYPPLIQELIKVAIDVSPALKFLVAEKLGGSFEDFIELQQGVIRSERGVEQNLVWRQKNGIVDWSADALSSPGFYKLEFSSINAQHAVDLAINIRNTDGDLRITNPEKWQSPVDATAEVSRETEIRFQVYQFFLLGVGVLLLLEGCLAQWFGRGR
ncbi:BatA domain-containing protein [Pirellulaceae bacterium]|nr:BatA domain-containing protein [Pirellulaceae bacterium]